MSSIIPRLLQNESVFCDNDIEFMFNRYNQLKGVGSQEGLGLPGSVGLCAFGAEMVLVRPESAT